MCQNTTTGVPKRIPTTIATPAMHGSAFIQEVILISCQINQQRSSNRKREQI